MLTIAGPPNVDAMKLSAEFYTRSSWCPEKREQEDLKYQEEAKASPLEPSPTHQEICHEKSIASTWDELQTEVCGQEFVHSLAIQ